MKKILVPCDFSDQAKKAYKFAIDIASKSQGELLVLYVVDLPFLYETTFNANPAWHDPDLAAELAELAKQDYNNIKKLHSKESISEELIMENGPVSSSILKIIHEKQVDLVIMGKRGANKFQEFVVGSNTNIILRSSPVPVIVIKQAPDLSLIRNIVFPSTLDMNQVELVSNIKVLQEFFCGILHILLVNTPLSFHRDKDAKKALEEFVKHYKLRDYTLNFRNDLNEYEGIINFALGKKADFVTMGTHGRKGLSRLLKGSITEEVLNNINCPVWTYVQKKIV